MKKIISFFFLTSLALADELSEVTNTGTTFLKSISNILVLAFSIVVFILVLAPFLLGGYMGYKKMEEAKKTQGQEDPKTAFIITFATYVVMGYIILAAVWLLLKVFGVDPALFIRNVIGGTTTSGASITVGQ